MAMDAEILMMMLLLCVVVIFIRTQRGVIISLVCYHQMYYII